MRRTSLFFILILANNLWAAEPKPALNVDDGTRKEIIRYFQNAEQWFMGLTPVEKEDIFSIEDAKGNLRSIVQSSATKVAGDEWGLRDPEQNGVEGTSTERAYKELQLKAPKKPILVAVIDSGVDIHHEDLVSQIWVNEAEKGGKQGFDNDGNGYAGDVYGWNFLGNKSGKNLIESNLEVARESARLTKKEANGGLTKEEKVYFELVKSEFTKEKTRYETRLAVFKNRLNELQAALEILRAVGLKEETEEAVSAIHSNDPAVIKAKDLALKYLNDGLTTARLKSSIGTIERQIANYFSLEFDPSQVIGDDPNRLDDFGYGNPDVMTETAMHGTHVSGIIGASRDNGVGMNGQSQWVKILAIRAVPDGDERDKDIANAVRYAVDQGARVINMSFGKRFSPHKKYVDEAFRYAETHGVLVVHAAGNSALDNDRFTHYPSRKTQDSVTGLEREFSNWIEVGASTSKKGPMLPARFSNYGQNTVDLFAPGDKIYSTVPGNKYEALSGTSMATPEVAGVAALVLSQYPELTAADLKAALLQSVRKYDSLKIILPGTPDVFVGFETLSATGGVLDALNALKYVQFSL